MSKISVSFSTQRTDYVSFAIELYLKRDCSTKELISEEFKIFCDSVALRFRFKWSEESRMNIFTQLKSLNGVTYRVKNEVEHASKLVDIMETDSYMWQLTANYNQYLYTSRSPYLSIKLHLCNQVPFKKLYKDADFTDFELFAENDDVQSVPVHRNVLAVSSPVLKSMLLGDWKEAKQGYVQTPGVTKNTLQHFKEYIYLNKLPNEPMDYAKLVTLASYYMLFDLTELEQRGTEMLEKFDANNTWEWFEYCVEHKNTKLLLLRLNHFTEDRIRELEEYFESKTGNTKEAEEASIDKLKHLYDDTDFTNFELGSIETEDGVSFHKNVLGVFSPVMKTLFLGDWKEAKKACVHIPNISRATLQHFKDYVYLNKTPDDPMDCSNLFPLASYYKMPGLERAASLKIAQYFQPENAWEWFEYCVQNKAECLLVAILRNIVNEWKMDSLKEYFLKN